VQTAKQHHPVEPGKTKQLLLPEDTPSKLGKWAGREQLALVDPSLVGLGWNLR